MTQDRILTGMRPTGALHLGHYFGALENWVAAEQEYECFFLIADYQALGDYSTNVDLIRESVREVVLDWLAVGLNPEKSAFVVQSYVPEHAELHMLLSMIARKSELDKNPTLKAEIARMEQSNEPVTVGFQTYPVSQVADILLPMANLVPVGEDQVPHIEFTRTIARRFNRTYSTVFPEPQALVGRVPRLVGIDGQAKMSKSLDNAIDLRDEDAVLRKKVGSMVTDTTGANPRLNPSDPGIVENNPVFLYLDAINANNEEENEELKAQYRAGSISDKALKDRLFELLSSFLTPIRERRHEFARNPGAISDALAAGSDRERTIAQATMIQVREAMRITSY